MSNPRSPGSAESSAPPVDDRVDATRPGAGHTRPGGFAEVREITRTSTSVLPTRRDATGTLVVPVDTAAVPEVAHVRGLRLDQLLLATTVALVVLIVALLAVLSSLSTQAQFEEIAGRFTERLHAHARELGQTVNHTLALTSATSLRDNNYAFLGEVTRSILADNENILRVQMFDGEGLSVADSDPKVPLGTPSGRSLERRWASAFYQGKPVFEFQEPIDYGSQTGRGAVLLSYSLKPLQAQLGELEDAKRATLRRSTLRIMGMGAGFVILAAILAAVQSRRITRPLGALTGKVMQLAAGDLTARADVQRAAGREVRVLGVVFNHMAERIKVLLDDVRAKAQLEREMSLARTVQETLLPGREALQVGPLRIAGLVVPADACGGDWWLRSTLEDGRVVLGIGDVTGHGLSTALVAASATSGFAAAINLRAAQDINAQLLITSLNLTLANIGKGEHQMSASLAVIDLKTGRLEFASGGHPPACVYNRQTRQFASLMARGALLGASVNSQYVAREAQLRPGDVVVLYSDGLTESRDAGNKLYGFQRLCASVQANAHLNAEALRDVLLADARAFSAGQAPLDDITVIVAEFSPNTPGFA